MLLEMHKNHKTRFHTSEIGVFKKMIAPLEVRTNEEDARLHAVLEFIKNNSNHFGQLSNVDLAVMRVNGPSRTDFPLRTGMGRLRSVSSHRETLQNWNSDNLSHKALRF